MYKRVETQRESVYKQNWVEYVLKKITSLLKNLKNSRKFRELLEILRKSAALYERCKT